MLRTAPPCGHVHPTHPHPRRRRVLHLPPRALRTHRQQGPPTHPARSRTALRCRARPRADALPAHRRTPRRPAAPAAGHPPGTGAHAQRIAAAPLAGEGVGTAAPPTDRSSDLQQVDANSPEVLRSRPVGMGHAGPWAMGKPAPPDLPGRPGIAPSLRAAAVGPIIARNPTTTLPRHPLHEECRWILRESSVGPNIRWPRLPAGPIR